MAFDLAKFQEALQLATAGVQEAGAVAQEWNTGDHQGALNSAVQTVGALAQAATTDPAKQQEITMVTQLTTTLLPSVFAFAQMIAQKHAAENAAKVPAPPKPPAA